MRGKEEVEERARRCLYSVAAVPEGLAGHRLDADMGMGALMPERLDPWREARAGARRIVAISRRK